MTIGKRIIKKYNNNEIDYNEELRDLKKLLFKIQENISPIKYEVPMKRNYLSKLTKWVKLVDKKLFEVQEKIFEPENIKMCFNIIYLKYIEDWPSICFFNEEETITMFDIEISENDGIHTPFIDFLFDNFLDNFYKILNINYWLLLIVGVDYINIDKFQKDVGKLKIISINDES